MKAFTIQENMIAAECASIFCISEDQIQAFVYISFVKKLWASNTREFCKIA
jgi:hypothetical protein